MKMYKWFLVYPRDTHVHGYTEILVLNEVSVVSDWVKSITVFVFIFTVIQIHINTYMQGSNLTRAVFQC